MKWMENGLEKVKMEKIKCKYIFDDRYNPKYANGAFGGINSRGEIIINFYLERMPIPNSQTFLVSEGKLAEEIEDDRAPEDHARSVVRFVENGIILNYANAKEIHRWLGEHIEALEKNLKNE